MTSTESGHSIVRGVLSRVECEVIYALGMVTLHFVVLLLRLLRIRLRTLIISDSVVATHHVSLLHTNLLASL